MARIAIIDDAIHDSLLNSKVVLRYRYDNGNFVVSSPPAHEHYTHGTIVLKILENYSSDLEIISVELLDDWFLNRKCSTARLISALELCTHLDVDIIHISLGSTRLSESIKMNASIRQITMSGIPIIAACSNEFYRTIPAAYPEVLGVIYDPTENLHEGTFAEICNPYLGINYISNNIRSIPNTLNFSKSNSLSAAVITARVNELINNGTERKISSIIRELKKEASLNQQLCNWEPHPISQYTSIPVVCLFNIFSKDEKQQIALLNEFAAYGYEAVGISCISDIDDVRIFKYADFGGQNLKTMQTNIIAYTQSDLLIIFLDTNVVDCGTVKQYANSSDVLCIGYSNSTDGNSYDAATLFSILVKSLCHDYSKEN